jgi:hypothetical protein
MIIFIVSYSMFFFFFHVSIKKEIAKQSNMLFLHSPSFFQMLSIQVNRIKIDIICSITAQVELVNLILLCIEINLEENNCSFGIFFSNINGQCHKSYFKDFLRKFKDIFFARYIQAILVSAFTVFLSLHFFVSH